MRTSALPRLLCAPASPGRSFAAISEAWTEFFPCLASATPSICHTAPEFGCCSSSSRSVLSRSALRPAWSIARRSFCIARPQLAKNDDHGRRQCEQRCRVKSIVLPKRHASQSLPFASAIAQPPHGRRSCCRQRRRFAKAHDQQFGGIDERKDGCGIEKMKMRPTEHNVYQEEREAAQRTQQHGRGGAVRGRAAPKHSQPKQSDNWRHRIGQNRLQVLPQRRK